MMSDTEINSMSSIPWGGSQASSHLLKLAQLKYPTFPTRVTPAQASIMWRETAYFAQDYAAELDAMSTESGMKAKTTVVQFDYAVATEAPEKTPAELAAAAERRVQQMDRLREQSAKKRAENVSFAELNRERDCSTDTSAVGSSKASHSNGLQVPQSIHLE